MTEVYRTPGATHFRVRHVQGGIFVEMIDAEGRAMGIVASGARPLVFPDDATASRYGKEQGWKEED